MSREDPFENILSILRILSAQMPRFRSHSTEDIDQALDEILRILSHGTRRRMLDELAKEEQWMNSIVEKLNEHPQAIARHLRALEKVRLVEAFPKIESGGERGRGRPRIYYKLNENVQRLMICSIERDELVQNFPELGLLRCQLEATTSPKDLEAIARRAFALSEIFQKAGKRSLELATEAEERIKKRKSAIYKVPVK
ncbi:MAG: ArsR/SmtB family transcription factor [Candidatus Hodarchaeota archaeon]